MGLADRDYMRERRNRDDRPFGPPASKGPSVLWILFVWICVAFILFKAFSWWEQKKSRPASAPRQQVHVAAESSTPAPPPVLRERRPAPVEAERTITKCIHNGVTTYSDTGCDSMAANAPTEVGTVQVERRPAEVNPPTSSRSATSGTIYLCKGYDGGTFWAQTHCNQHRAHIDRIARVPEGMPFTQQVSVAEQQLRSAQRVQAAAVHTSNGVDHTATNRKAICAAFDAEIRAIDARARQPLSGQEQDRLAARRKKVRSEQFQLRC